MKSLFPNLAVGKSSIVLFTHKDELETEKFQTEMKARSEIYQFEGIDYLGWSSTHVDS